MKDLSEQFNKYQTAKHAKQLEPRAKELGITVRELATQLAKAAQEESGDQEEAMALLSIALYEARREQGPTLIEENKPET